MVVWEVVEGKRGGERGMLTERTTAKESDQQRGDGGGAPQGDGVVGSPTAEREDGEVVGLSLDLRMMEEGLGR